MTAPLLVKFAPSDLHEIFILFVKHCPAAEVMIVFGLLYQCSLLVAHSSHGLTPVPLFVVKVLIICSNKH